MGTGKNLIEFCSACWDSFDLYENHIFNNVLDIIPDERALIRYEPI